VFAEQGFAVVIADGRGTPGRGPDWDRSIAEDETTVLFLRSRAGDDPVGCLWAVQAGSGTERLLADPAELLGGPGGRARGGRP